MNAQVTPRSSDSSSGVLHDDQHPADAIREPKPVADRLDIPESESFDVAFARCLSKPIAFAEPLSDGEPFPYYQPIPEPFAEFERLRGDEKRKRDAELGRIANSVSRAR